MDLVDDGVFSSDRWLCEGLTARSRKAMRLIECNRIFAVILQSVSVNFQMFIAARFFLGFGVAIAHGAAPLLITELCHPQHRAIFTTIVSLVKLIFEIIH